MQLSLEIEGASSVAETAELRAWLHDVGVRVIERITREETPPKPGEQGPTLLAILTVVLDRRPSLLSSRASTDTLRLRNRGQRSRSRPVRNRCRRTASSELPFLL